MADQTHNATRRAILGAAILAPAIVACGASAATTVNPSGKWRELVATFRVAHAEEKRVRKTHSEREDAWMPRARLIDQQKPKQPVAAPINTALSVEAIIAATETTEWKRKWATYKAETEAWKASRDAEEAAIMGDIEELMEAADDVSYAAFCAVRDYEIPTLALLAEKVAVFHERYEGHFEGGEAVALMLDINRLAAREA